MFLFLQNAAIQLLYFAPYEFALKAKLKHFAPYIMLLVGSRKSQSHEVGDFVSRCDFMAQGLTSGATLTPQTGTFAGTPNKNALSCKTTAQKNAK